MWWIQLSNCQQSHSWLAAFSLQLLQILHISIDTFWQSMLLISWFRWESNWKTTPAWIPDNRFKHTSRKFTHTIMNWWTIMECPYLKLATQKLLNQGYVAPKLQSSFLKFYGRHHDLVDRYDKTGSKMKVDLFSWATRQVSRRQQRLLIFPKHLSLPKVWLCPCCSFVFSF